MMTDPLIDAIAELKIREAMAMDEIDKHPVGSMPHGMLKKRIERYAMAIRAIEQIQKVEMYEQFHK